MADYIVEYTYNLPEEDAITVVADDETQAREFAMEDIQEMFPEITNIEITSVKVVDLA